MKKNTEWPNAPQVLKDLHARLLAAHILSTLDSKLVPAMLQEVLDVYWDTVIEAVTAPADDVLTKVRGKLEAELGIAKPLKAGLSDKRPNRQGEGLWAGNLCKRNKFKRIKAVLESLSSTIKEGPGPNDRTFIWMSASTVARDIGAPKRKVEFILNRLAAFHYAGGGTPVKRNSARYEKGVRVVHQYMMNVVVSTYGIDKTMQHLVDGGVA